ncbi:AaceriAGR104Wp [[Ashbya] aceris (nom. inval.)]|nr:AaceriAGR104Wp [[Ashbya] aceris (nom. inval.)]
MVVRPEISLPLTTLGTAIDLNPPVTPSTDRPPSSNESSPLLSVTPRSGRRWTERLVPKRKRILHSPEQIKSATQERRPASALVSPVTEFPLRSTSIPTPPKFQKDIGLLNNQLQMSPMPFMGEMKAESFLSPKKSIVNARCCLCDEPVSTRSNGERIITLECDHSCHEDCLLVFLEENSSDASQNRNEEDDIYAVFPACKACEYSAGVNKCIPKDETLRDKLISQYLIKRTKPILRSQVSPLPPMDIPLTKPARPFGLQNTKRSVQRPAPLTLTSMPLLSPPRKRNGSVTSSISSLASSVQVKGNDPSAEASTRYLAVLRSYFVQSLLVNYPDWEVDSSFGLLRLVDSFSCSSEHGTGGYQDSVLYLFEHRLVVGIPVNMPTHTMVGVKFSSIRDYDISSFKVDTFQSSVLKLTFDNDTIYISEGLLSHTTKVLEKWISALLNIDMLVNSTNFTSTLPLPDLEDEDIHSIRRMDIMTRATDVNNSVIVRRSVCAHEKSMAKNAENSTMRATINSILSLKRRYPDELCLFFQIDTAKVQAVDYKILANICKAILWKFSAAKVALADKNGGIVTMSTLKAFISLFSSIDDLLTRHETRRKLSPDLVYRHFYGEERLTNIGVCIISNSAMQYGKSLLLMDYSIFCNIGKRRPNELKVKVGYLNTDYSDQVYELVETGGWGDVLEVVCYSFNMAFGQDDYSDDDDDDETEDYVTEEDVTESESIHDQQATSSPATHFVSTPTTADVVYVQRSDRESIIDPDQSGSVRSLQLQAHSASGSRRSPCSEYQGIPILQPARASGAWSSLITDLDNALNDVIANTPSPTFSSDHNGEYSYL